MMKLEVEESSGIFVYEVEKIFPNFNAALGPSVLAIVVREDGTKDFRTIPLSFRMQLVIEGITNEDIKKLEEEAVENTQKNIAQYEKKLRGRLDEKRDV